MISPVITSAPGRICLFGDYQDWLGLPVITAALSLRVKLTTWHHGPPGFRFRLPDLDTRLSIAADGTPLTDGYEPNYLRAGIRAMLEAGFTFSRGIEAEVRSALPMRVGLGSSTALTVAWLTALSQLADQPVSLAASELIALADEAAALAANDTANPLDAHTAVGGQVQYGHEGPHGLVADTLTPRLGTFIIAETPDGENTTDRQRQVKASLTGLLDLPERIHPAFLFQSATLPDLVEYKDQLSKTDYQLLKATLANRDLTTEALTLLHSATISHARLGQLFTQQHTYLRDALLLSTPPVDRLLDVALRAGALGGKVTAAGGGRSLFVYAPNAPAAIAEAIERAGGKATVVQVGEGVLF